MLATRGFRPLCDPEAAASKALRQRLLSHSTRDVERLRSSGYGSKAIAENQTGVRR